MAILTSAGKIRLLLIDDHPLLRAGLANLLEMESDFLVVGQASTGEEGLDVVRRCRPDVCLLDLNLPGIDGFETLRRLRHETPTARVIVLTSSDAAEDAARLAEPFVPLVRGLPDEVGGHRADRGGGGELAQFHRGR